MAVTHSAGAKKAMREAVAAMKTHKVIAYIACASGHKAVVVDAHEGDDIRSIVMEREQGKHGGGVVYLAHERQEDALFARSAMQGSAREDFIRQRVSYLRSMHETQATPDKRVLKPKACTGCGATDGQYHSLVCPTMDVQHPLSDEAEAISRAAVKGELEDGAYGVERNMRTPYWQQMLEGDWKVDPSPTPFMQHAMSRKEAEGLYGTSMAEFAQQAMRGADFERMLEQVRKDQEELCGIKVGVDPAVGCDTFVISTGRRAGKTALIDAVMGMGPAVRAGKSIEEIMREACERLWGSTPKMPAQDPSAARDEIAMARGSCKPQNKPHKDEKPANPYPPSHPKAAPAGLLAVSAMEARMGNRWAP